VSATSKSSETWRDRKGSGEEGGTRSLKTRSTRPPRKTPGALNWVDKGRGRAREIRDTSTAGRKHQMVMEAIEIGQKDGRMTGSGVVGGCGGAACPRRVSIGENKGLEGKGNTTHRIGQDK